MNYIIAALLIGLALYLSIEYYERKG